MRSLLLALILSFVAICAVSKTSKPRDAASVRKEQAEVNKKMGKTKEQIEQNKRQTLNKLNQINSLNAQISSTNENIAAINQTIIDLSKKEESLHDSISIIDSEMEKLRHDYKQMLRNARKRHKDLSELSLVFSAKTFNSAMKRSSYIHQVGVSIDQKAQSLRILQQDLDAKRQELANLKEKQQQLLAQLSAEKNNLNNQKQETQNLVNQLKNEANTLSEALKQQQQQARSLDAELNRIIEEEARKAAEERLAREAEERRLAEQRKKQEEKEKAQQQKQKGKKADKSSDKNDKSSDKNDKSSDKKDKKKKGKKNDETLAVNTQNSSVAPSKPSVLTGSFASNKGRLLFPVNGKYRIVGTFGVQKHKDLPYVQTENSGIDIEAQPGATARAVYDGEVSSIFFHPGYHNIVMVRHGEYLTVYANIDKLSVKKGDKIKAGQTLGKVFSDSSDGNRTVLHFEVRKEKQKLNPLEWVSR